MRTFSTFKLMASGSVIKDIPSLAHTLVILFDEKQIENNISFMKELMKSYSETGIKTEKSWDQSNWLKEWMYNTTRIIKSSNFVGKNGFKSDAKSINIFPIIVDNQSIKGDTEFNEVLEIKAELAAYIYLWLSVSHELPSLSAFKSQLIQGIRSNPSTISANEKVSMVEPSEEETTVFIKASRTSDGIVNRISRTDILKQLLASIKKHSELCEKQPNEFPNIRRSLINECEDFCGPNLDLLLPLFSLLGTLSYQLI